MAILHGTSTNKYVLFLNKRHESSIMQKYDTSNNSESLKTSESREISLFLRLPYLRNISLQIEKEIWQYLIKSFPTKFRFRLTHDTHNFGKCFKFKDRQALLHNAGVVYKLNCSCGQSYIGQTHRNLATRIQEHVPNGKQNQMLQNTLCAILTTRLISILPKYLVKATTTESYESEKPYSFKKFSHKLTWMVHRNRFVCLLRNSYRKYIFSALLKLTLPC